jgi:hypothetical protein
MPDYMDGPSLDSLQHFQMSLYEVTGTHL